MTIKHQYCTYCGKKMTTSPLRYCSTKCENKYKSYQRTWYEANQMYHNILSREWHSANRKYHNLLNWKWRNNSKTRPTWLKCCASYNKENPPISFTYKRKLYVFRQNSCAYDGIYQEYLEFMENWREKYTHTCIRCGHTWVSICLKKYLNKPKTCHNCGTSHWENNDNRVYKKSVLSTVN